ncbi:MAG: thiamine pyrophosphate-dependent dehydrogenase E1 component subunit alpha [Candidatus Omnitrophica bacterium]|nr:thiamine pyrophosphate-dependent dehydrogenase E1 component subunit alpha [Candidatus Omnitrophota bacterium]
MEAAPLYEELFYKALRIRLVEERIADIYPSDKIQSPVHLSIGQESVAVGTCQSLRKTDLLFGNYRGHAFYLAKGGGLREMFAELFGRVTGCSGGKGGSMHLADPQVGMMGSSALVASTIPHAVGAALAANRLMKDQVIVAVFGDGATEQGVYHESLNFAALHQLPVIFICENNGLAVHSRLKARQAFQISEHARSYGLSATRIPEGYDFMQVYGEFSRLVQLVRQDRKPRFVEIQTFRFREHVGPGEDYEAGYRSRKELECWKAKDPLVQDQALVERFRHEINREIDAAVAFADASEAPQEEHVLSDVI